MAVELRVAQAGQRAHRAAGGRRRGRGRGPRRSGDVPSADLADGRGADAGEDAGADHRPDAQHDEVEGPSVRLSWCRLRARSRASVASMSATLFVREAAGSAAMRRVMGEPWHRAAYARIGAPGRSRRRRGTHVLVVMRQGRHARSRSAAWWRPSRRADSRPIPSRARSAPPSASPATRARWTRPSSRACPACSRSSRSPTPTSSSRAR